MKIDPLNKTFLEKLTGLRKTLHKNPELSGNEKNTVRIIHEFIKSYNPDKIYNNPGSNGIAFEFDSGKTGPCVVFRADLDALPIEEELKVDYISVHPGVAHKCGHDGHMSILAGMAAMIQHKKPEKGKVVLLFQPEEETGQGAEKVIHSSDWKTIMPDFVFGLHNLPGFPKGSILVREHTFAAASKGLIVELKGKTSHAGHPENGISPAKAISRIIEFCRKNESDDEDHDFRLVTVIHILLGEEAFGTAPGKARVLLTLRTPENKTMEKLAKRIKEGIGNIASEEKLECCMDFTEEFPATINAPEYVNFIRDAANESKLLVLEMEEPFRWSEDFGHYLMHHKGAFFGLGAGEDHPQLHNPDYDFPDEIMESGIKIFYALYKMLLFEK